MPEETKLADELERMPYEPLLDIEKKLILWSLGLGVALLVVLGVLSYVLTGSH